MVFIIIGSVILFLAILYIVFICSAFEAAVGRADKFFDVFSDKDAEKLHLSKNIDDIRKGAGFIRKQPSEEIYISSTDGLRLHGKFIPAENAKATVILFHGFRSFAEFEFSLIAEKYHKRGYNLLLATQRAHGKSEGKYITFGLCERLDCAKWAEYIAERFPSLPIVLEGVSMGATTVLMASGEKLPKNVRCVIADCGFTSPEEIFVYVAKHKLHLPPALFVPAFSRLFKKKTGHAAGEFSTIDALRETSLPVLFIHGEADNFVPCEMSRKGADACGSEHILITVPGASHGKSYVVDKEKCDKALDEFLDKYV